MEVHEFLKDVLYIFKPYKLFPFLTKLNHIRIIFTYDKMSNSAPIRQISLQHRPSTGKEKCAAG